MPTPDPAHVSQVRSAASPEGEHIFPATRLTALAIRWKECVAEGNDGEAAEILEDIVKSSEPMFRRFAQHEGFDRSIDLESLVSVAQEKVVRWLMAWRPHDGRLFSWFTICAKNVWRSEVNKQAVYRRRFHVTSDSLEVFFGSEDHAVERKEAEAAADAKLRDICSRWGSVQEVGTLRYLFDCIRDSEHNKPASIRAAAYAWGLDPDQVKFFYNWCLVALRNAFYEKIRTPFTEQDLFRHAHSYDHLADLLDLVTFAQMKKIIAVLGGMRLKIPTLAQMAKLAESHLIWRDIEDTEKDPAAVEAVGKKHKRSGKAAQEVYEEMSATLNEGRSTEEPIFT